jgi:hypothetical protein
VQAPRGKIVRFVAEVRLLAIEVKAAFRGKFKRVA